MRSVEALEAQLAQPSDALVEDITTLEGDILVLGAGGKMGPSLAKLARNAVVRAGVKKEVSAVSRFSQPGLREELEISGVRTIAADLLGDGMLEALPEAENVIYMAGTKFGTSGRESLTWAQNAFLPGLIGRRYRNARIVVFSTGNVYGLVNVATGGSNETDAADPVGEYAQSCLGRERLFEYASHRFGTRILLFRLNYAIDLRYGILLDIAQAVREGNPIDLGMGHANVIWQGDANEMALRSLRLCSTPPTILNVTGPETVSIRWLAGRFGQFLRREPKFVHEEQETALLNNAAKAHALFGYPRVPLERMIAWTADWLLAGGETLGKPTHFNERKGHF